MKRVLSAGLAGGVVLLVWFVVVNGLLGFKGRIDMKPLPDERLVYEVLRENVPEPGKYACNPELTGDRRFIGDAPVFGVHYSGLGHDDAGRESLVGLAVFLLAPILGAWLLSRASDGVLARFGSRFLFFATIGVVIGLIGFQARFGIGGYSFGDAAALTIHDIAAWAVAGLAVAGLLKPARGRPE
ncbi:MAG: hypothetical protein JW958_08115 [Candidatus Eisenbacteria bacterium]|nr:hypothetical protein [Candidatus Eisenbacteria bacterium]